MAFHILYKKLFQVEFRQNYYLNYGAEEFASLSNSEQEERLEAYRSTYGFIDDFRVIPTRETRAKLSGLGLLCKTSSTGFFVAVPANETSADRYVSRRPPAGPLRLRFALRLSAPAFMNYTNLSFHDHRQKIYYFSNLSEQGNRSRTFPFLSHVPAAYEEGTVYNAGDIVRRRPTNPHLYLSLENGAHRRPRGNPPRTSPWRRLSGRNYVSTEDRVSLYPPAFSFVFPEATVVEASFKAVAPDGDEHDAGDLAAPAGETLNSYSLDLRLLRPGRYRLEVEGLDINGDAYAHMEEIYLDPEMPAQNLFAMVEVFHPSRGPEDDYNLIDTDDHLRQTQYVIHFLNRYTFWRYFFRTPPDPVPDSSDFDRIDDRQYVYKESLPLTKSFIPLRSDGVRLLPNPATPVIKPEENRVYSDIHVHL
jgi:hypothetical protein